MEERGPQVVWSKVGFTLPVSSGRKESGTCLEQADALGESSIGPTNRVLASDSDPDGDGWGIPLLPSQDTGLGNRRTIGGHKGRQSMAPQATDSTHRILCCVAAQKPVGLDHNG